MNKVCATCGKEIEGDYYKCLDNFIQVKYFDNPEQEDNIFCSESCFCKALSLGVISSETGEIYI